MKVNNKTIIYFGLLILWLGLLAGLLVYPLWGKVKSKSNQLHEKQKKIAAVETQRKRLKSMEQSLKEAKPDLRAIDSLFINKEAPVGFLEFLEETAMTSDLNIDITPSAGQKENEPWSPTFFNVTGEGNFENCVKFATKLEYAPYLLEVQSLNLEKVKKKDKKESSSKSSKDKDSNSKSSKDKDSSSSPKLF